MITHAPQAGSGEMFDAIAERYDLLNRVLSLGIDLRWRARTVAAIAGSKRVLDVATGTGDLAIAMSRWGSHVVGIDPSEKMLAIARRKIAKRGLDIEVMTGDAQALPFDDASFDATTISFGIRNVPDRALALREMARVTRPGGRIAVLEFSEPRRGILAPIARFHVHTVVPVLGAWLSGAREYRYLARSIAAFPEPAEFAAMIASAGYQDVAITPLTFGVCSLYTARRSA